MEKLDTDTTERKMNKYKTGQDVMKDPSGSAICGFNCRIGGHSYLDTFQHPHERTDAERHAGWELADRMIEAGKLFFVHNFHRLSCERGHAFPYGFQIRGAMMR